jgi:hypothetical protein
MIMKMEKEIHHVFQKILTKIEPFQNKKPMTEWEMLPETILSFAVLQSTKQSVIKTSNSLKISQPERSI